MKHYLSTLPISICCILTCICLFASGCTRPLNLRGDNFKDEYATWGQNNRPVDESNGMYGFSTKAQQIERNLGVQ